MSITTVTPVKDGNATAENWALAVGAAGGIIGFMVGLIFLPAGEVALSGDQSLGNLTAFTAGVLGAVVFLFGYIRAGLLNAEERALRQQHRVRVAINTFALTLAGAFVAFLLLEGSFYVMQQAFVDLKVQHSSAVVIIAVAVGASSYMLFSSATNMNTKSVSLLLTLFLLSGVLSAMLTADNPLWWQMNFSSLGAGQEFSSNAFNVTVTLSGLIIMTMADYLTRDLYSLVQNAGLNHPERRVATIRWVLIVVGLAFMFVGLFPVNENLFLHNVGAQLLFGGFCVLVFLVPVLLKVFPKSFIALSVVFLILTVWSILLFIPLGYYNLTGSEMIAMFLVFVWLILFVRTVSAQVEDQQPVTTINK